MSENSITRGTNPVFNFVFPFHTEEVKNFYFTVTQEEKEQPVIDKGLSECSLSSYTASVRLTQKDTLKLAPGTAYWQVRILVRENSYASPICTVTVNDVLKEEEI